MSRLVEALMAGLGLGQTIVDRTLAGTAPEMISVPEICMLMEPANADQIDERILNALNVACAREELKAYLKHVDHMGKCHPTAFVKRADARQFFRILDIQPEANSPLWCWLTTSVPERDCMPSGRKPRACHKDKQFFQMFCRFAWADDPTWQIEGADGLIALFDRRNFLEPYKYETLVKWARTARPLGKGKPGRPPKRSVI